MAKVKAKKAATTRRRAAASPNGPKIEVEENAVATPEILPPSPEAATILEQEALVLTLFVAFLDGLCRAKVLDSAGEKTARELQKQASALRVMVGQVTGDVVH